MTHDEFVTAIRYLEGEAGHAVWPGAMAPMARELHPSDGGPVYAGRQEWPEDEASWTAYQYNPPQFAPLLVPAADARPEVRDKPTWEQLQLAAATGALEEARTELLQQLRVECELQIQLAYEARDAWDELHLRLRGDATDEQDTERDRLRTLYRGYRAQVTAATTVAALRQLSPFDWTHSEETS